jgi:hypothetical protein
MLAIFNSPLGVLIASSGMIFSEWAKNNVRPFTGLRSSHLEGLTGALVSDESVFSVVESPLETTLGSETKTVTGGGINASSGLAEAIVVRAESFGRAIIPEFLILIIEDPFFETTSLIVAVKDKRSRFVFFRFSMMEVHADISLHGGGLRLEATGSPLNVVIFRDSVALKNFKIKVDIGVKRNWFTTKRSLSISITPSVMSWASKLSLSTCFKLRNSKIPTLENVGFTNGENLR